MQFSLTIDDYKQTPVPLIMAFYRAMKVARVETTIGIYRYPRLASVLKGKLGLGLHLPYFDQCGYDLGYVPGKERIHNFIETVHRNQNRFTFDYAVFHPPESDAQHASIPFLCENLRNLNLPVILENNLGSNFDTFLRIEEEIRGELGDGLAGICLDIPHAFLAKEKWQQFYQQFGSRIRVVHLSDCDGLEDSHLPFPFAGGLNLEDIMAELMAFRFDGILNFEIAPPSLHQIQTLFQTLRNAEKIYLKNKQK